MFQKCYKYFRNFDQPTLIGYQLPVINDIRRFYEDKMKIYEVYFNISKFSKI